jgi:uncharacterized protein (TIGR00730 family)
MKKSLLMVFISLLISFIACNTDSNSEIKLSPEMCKTQGRNLPYGVFPTPKDLAKDAYCALQVIKRNAPNGVITIFGSARARENMKSYKDTRKFASLWTKSYGDKYPILTGGGPGIMEAGNRGAKESGGKSLSFSSFFGSGVEKPNKYTTDGFMFTSFSQREADMVDHAAAIVIAPGGIGTEWEIYESLAKLQTKKKNPCAVVLLGEKSMWKSLFARLHYLGKIKTISVKDISLLQVAETPEKAVAIIKKSLYKK